MITKQQTLFERIGGDQAIAELTHKFYVRVVADPELKPFFKNASIEKIRRMQREFFSAALDGSITYTGKPMMIQFSKYYIWLSTGYRKSGPCRSEIGRLHSINL